MKVVVALDSFKGSLSSKQAGRAVKCGILKAKPDAQVEVFPVADGGEGTVEALCERKITAKALNPLGEEIVCQYGVIGKTAVIEMSAAAGITLIPDNLRNPLNTTTFGVGQLILDAIDRGYRDFLIGIGGSATNDGGLGMLTALGFEFFNKDTSPISIFGRGLLELDSINNKNADSRLSQCCFSVACDVKNPLCGVSGCSAVFGPQKGATEEMIKSLDDALNKFAKLTRALYPNADETKPGCGAAGGLGFAFMTYLSGCLQSGVDSVIEKTELERYIKEADIVVVGEGKIDLQTALGKAPAGIARIAKKYGKRVIAFGGSIGDGAESCRSAGIDAYFAAINSAITLDKAMQFDTASKNLQTISEQVFRLL
jgi:glycerate kinase